MKEQMEQLRRFLKDRIAASEERQRALEDADKDTEALDEMYRARALGQLQELLDTAQETGGDSSVLVLALFLQALDELSGTWQAQLAQAREAGRASRERTLNVRVSALQEARDELMRLMGV